MRIDLRSTLAVTLVCTALPAASAQEIRQPASALPWQASEAAVPAVSPHELFAPHADEFPAWLLTPPSSDLDHPADKTSVKKTDANEDLPVVETGSSAMLGQIQRSGRRQPGFQPKTVSVSDAATDRLSYPVQFFNTRRARASQVKSRLR